MKIGVLHVTTPFQRGNGFFYKRMSSVHKAQNKVHFLMLPQNTP